MEMRTEADSFGSVRVPANRYWGAQTQRSLENFAIGIERFPEIFLRSFGVQKKACALVNLELGQLDPRKGGAIVRACDEIIAGKWYEEFPLSVWQTGSGTQIHMNFNEVIANRASEILGGKLGGERLVHPNDHVNLGQSTNDSFPTVLHIAAAMDVEHRVMPALRQVEEDLHKKSQEFSTLIKIGRTHLQDATPITLGQEFSGYAQQVRNSLVRLQSAMPWLMELAQGGTAVGTGLNAHPLFARMVATKISDLTGLAFSSAPNKFEALGFRDGILFASGAVKSAAMGLMKIGNDLRWLASGPRCGLGEITLPENEPGSSFMPGKVNPTQIEALTMVCVQIYANDAAIAFAASQGNFELNVFMPLMAHSFLQSTRLISDVCHSLSENCLEGIVANRKQLDENVGNSIMLASALTPHIGYDRAAHIARRAHHDGVSVRDAALASGLVSAEEWERWVRVEDMLGSSSQNSRDTVSDSEGHYDLDGAYFEER